jgi:hypothetical protein
MKLRNLLTATLLITSLVAAPGCDSALTPGDNMAPLGTAQKALTHEVRECVSNAPHISDSWCQAVACAETYVTSGYCRYLDETDDDGTCPPAPECATDSLAEDTTGNGCADACLPVETASVPDVEEPTAVPADTHPQPFYPNWTVGNCVDDGEEPAWENNLYDVATDCCRTHFNWKYDACIADARRAGANNDAPQELAETDGGSEPVIDADEDALDATTDSDDALESDGQEGEVELTAGSDNTVNVELDETDSVEEEGMEEDETVDVRGDSSTCPEGWDYDEIDCSYTPWQHSQAWFCSQKFAPNTTDACGEQEDGTEFCLVPDAETGSSFGMGEGVAGSQKRCVNPDYEDDTCENPIFCGRGMICGCAD